MPTESPQLISPIKQVELNGKSFDLGSDWHFPLDTTTDEIRRLILENQKSNVLMCLGDVFYTAKGEDSSGRISELLSALSPDYKGIIFTPGNHDLRGRENPWNTFRYPGNVIAPPKDYPIIAVVDGLRVLLANLFYDKKFIDKRLLGLTEEEILESYKGNPDGTQFLGGRLDEFPGMTDRALDALDSTIDVVATHVLPHPSLVTFRVPVKTAEHEKLERELGIPFTCNPEEDEAKGARWNVSGEDFRKWWNIKSMVMGSDFLNSERARFRYGLIAAYGHNHRSFDGEKMVRGKKVRLVSHQPYYGKLKE